MCEISFNPWVGKIPWRRKWQPTLVFLPGKSHGRRSLAGYSPWGCKELDTTGWFHSPSMLLQVDGFFWLNNVPLCICVCVCVCVCVCIISFIHPSVSGHLCCFHVLAIVNSAVMNRSYLIVFNELQPTPVLLPRKSHGRRSLVGYSPQRVRHNWTTSLSFFLSWKRRGVFCLPLNTLPYQFYMLASLGCHAQFSAKHQPVYISAKVFCRYN